MFISIRRRVVCFLFFLDFYLSSTSYKIWETYISKVHQGHNWSRRTPGHGQLSQYFLLGLKPASQPATTTHSHPLSPFPPHRHPLTHFYAFFKLWQPVPQRCIAGCHQRGNNDCRKARPHLHGGVLLERVSIQRSPPAVVALVAWFWRRAPNKSARRASPPESCLLACFALLA